MTKKGNVISPVTRAAAEVRKKWCDLTSPRRKTPKKEFLRTKKKLLPQQDNPLHQYRLRVKTLLHGLQQGSSLMVMLSAGGGRTITKYFILGSGYVAHESLCQVLGCLLMVCHSLWQYYAAQCLLSQCSTPRPNCIVVILLHGFNPSAE